MPANSKVKHVLMISPTPFFADRGCHVRILAETRALMSLGYQVTNCTYHIGRDIDNIKVVRMINIPWYKKMSAGPSLHKFYLDLFLLWTVIRTCLRQKPYVIHAHLHEGIVIGAVARFFFGVPLIADLQGSLTGELLQHHFIKPGSWIHRILSYVESIITRLPDAILTSSSMALDGMTKIKSGHQAKVHLIPDSVDTQTFHPPNGSEGKGVKLSIPKDVKIIGFLGVLTDYQGVSVLLEAIPHVTSTVKNVHFLIMGYPNVDYYRNKTLSLNISHHVTFTGRIPYEDAPRYLALCRVGVSPKLSRTEANGKLLNYMAMGLPIVASDTPINRDILGEYAVYAEVGSPISLAKALIKVLSDDKEANSRGRHLLERALSKFSWGETARKIEEVYKEFATI